MAQATLFGRYEPPVEHSGYRLNGRLDTLLQHRSPDCREFLASRNDTGTQRHRPESSWDGDSQLHDESLGDEGSEE